MSIEVLLVEDNPRDVRLTKEAFRGANNVHWNVVRDGAEALQFLKHGGDHLLAPCPNLILLDLGLPKLSGHKVLAEIKKDECLREIPVIVLTHSLEYGDMIKSYSLQANCYINKPLDFAQFENVAKDIADHWLS
jgi:two-component system, chemotaxis family, response regulator Rcp1